MSHPPASSRRRFLGNLFYNQPRQGDEHMDINTVHDVMVEDNVFFNDFAASNRRMLNNTHPFVLIKNSGSQQQTRNFLVRGNVFLNWEGLGDQSYLLLGDVRAKLHNGTGAQEAWQAGLAAIPANVAEKPSEMAGHTALLKRLGRGAETRDRSAALANMGYRDLG